MPKTRASDRKSRPYSALVGSNGFSKTLGFKKVKTLILATVALAAGTLICAGELRLGPKQTLAELNQKRGVRATMKPSKRGFENAVEISIEVEFNNGFLKNPNKADFVLTLNDDEGRCIANIPMDGFKEKHGKPGGEVSFYRMQITIHETLVKNSYLIFYDEEEAVPLPRITILYVYFSAIPKEKEANKTQK